MRTGVSSYSFKKYLNGEMPINEVIEMAVEIGYEEIEFVEFRLNDDVDVFEYAANVRELCKKAEIGVAAYTCGADFLAGSGGDPSKEAERLMKRVDVAATIGADKMRHDVMYGSGGLTYMQAVDKVAPYIRELTEYAGSKGVRTMTENHGHFIQDSYRVEYLVSKVNHPNYGVLVDIGNFLCADEDPAQAVSRLAPLAFHVHAKDFKYRLCHGAAPEESWGLTRGRNYLLGTIVGRGDVPVKQCLRILKAAGYEGSLGLEFEGPEDNMAALVEGYKFLKRVIDEI